MKPLPADAVPERGLLADYLTYAQPMTDAPLQYHLFTGLVVVSALLGNRVSISFGPQALMPNLYVVLIGRSTFSRKTTSIAIAQRILRRFEGIQVLPVRVLAGSIPRETKPPPCRALDLPRIRPRPGRVSTRLHGRNGRAID